MERNQVLSWLAASGTVIWTQIHELTFADWIALVGLISAVAASLSAIVKNSRMKSIQEALLEIELERLALEKARGVDKDD